MSRILIAAMAFESERGGGSVRMAYDIAIGLVIRGHQVTVVCEDLFGRGIEREVENGVTILRYCLPRSGGLRYRRYEEHIRNVKYLVNKYLKDPPDVVYGHHIFQYYAVLDLFQNRSRCCYTIHSPAIEELKITWGAQGLVGKIKSIFGLIIIKKIEYNILLRSSGLNVLSEYTANLIEHHYGKEVGKKIQKIPGWADIQIFHPINQNQIEAAKRQLGWPSNVPVLFVLRRLEPRMGLNNLLQALVLVKKKKYRLCLAIGGSGSLRKRLEKLIYDLGLKNDVIFMGFVPGRLLPLAYGACDASIIPTAKLECFGIIALEALACGRTTLVTPIGALPEVMRNIEPKWIAIDATPEGIAEIIISFLNNQLPNHSPQELHNIIERKYSYEQAIIAYERFLLGKNQLINL